MKLRTFFTKQRNLLLLLLTMRMLIIVACISLIGARFLIGYRFIEERDPLIEAIGAVDVDRVKHLLENGHNPDATDDDENSALLLACLNANYDERFEKIVQLLCEYYAQHNRRNNKGETEMHQLTRIDNHDHLVRLFETLILFGSYYDAKNNEGNSLLSELARLKNQHAMEALLSRYAPLFGVNDIAASLRVAAFYGYSELIEGVAPYAKAIETGKFVPASGSIQLSAQLIAALQRNTNQLLRTIAGDKSVDARDQNGNTLLHTVVMTGNSLALETLLSDKRIKNMITIKNNFGSYPVHYITTIRSFAVRKRMIELFLAAGAQFDIIDARGDTIFHLIVKKDDEELLVFMKHAMRNIDSLLRIKNKRGETPIDLARRLGKKTFINVAQQ